MFGFNPNFVERDYDKANAIAVEREIDEDESEIQVHDISDLVYVPTDVDNSDTQATVDRLTENAANINTPMVNGADTDSKLELLLTFDFLKLHYGSCYYSPTLS